jgi:uncharacterized membrane protein YcjF (UPF0283 family)
MAWISKRELELRDKQLAEMTRLFELERERADRLQDQLLLLHGHEPITPVVRTERAAKQAQESEEFKSRQEQMQEIFSDVMSAHEDLAPYSPEIQSQVDAMLRGN